ncbi:MAG: zinc ribbon domain-containing protein [Phycisphaerales bacterium]|nr:MAG: zinc ribbon domain-containing protein [Phycisphaerales bacterium]
MAPGDPNSLPHGQRIKDARGRKVTQLDPVTMRLLRQHHVIPPETLRKLADEIGVGWPRFVRLTFIVMLIALVLYLVASAAYSLKHAVSASVGLTAFAKRLSLLIPPLVGLLSIWFVSARVRFKRIRNIILRHSRCPHCGYDLRMLPVDPQDGATVCPECGCAWRLDRSQAGGDRRND